MNESTRSKHRKTKKKDKKSKKDRKAKKEKKEKRHREQTEPIAASFNEASVFCSELNGLKLRISWKSKPEPVASTSTDSVQAAGQATKFSNSALYVRGP